MKDDQMYLGHIRDAIEKIDGYIAGIDYDRFITNSMMVDAVVRELEIIGEAANKLGSDFHQAHPEIPFHDIIDMRNFLIHDYAGVNTKIVWETCKHNLPPLKKFVAEMLD